MTMVILKNSGAAGSLFEWQRWRRRRALARLVLLGLSDSLKVAETRQKGG